MAPGNGAWALAVVAASALGTVATPVTAQTEGSVRAVARVDAAPPVVAVDLTRESLAVRGSTFLRAVEHLEQVGPRAEDGSPRHAITVYEVGARWSAERLRDRCVLLTPSIRVDVRIRLPEWVDRDDAPRPERERWDEFLHALAEHEQAHADTAVEAAERILADLQGLSSRHCPALDRRAQVKIRKRVAELDRLQRALDAAVERATRQGPGGSTK